MVYRKEVVIPMEYIVPSLRIVVITKMIDVDAIEEILSQLVQLEEEFFIAKFHQILKNKGKKDGIIDTLRERTLRSEALFLCMTTNFSRIQ